jgi:hypothetical protein
VAHFSENWGFYTLLTQLPLFMKGDVSVCNGSTDRSSVVALIDAMNLKGHGRKPS